MTRARQSLGEIGENLACDELRRRGYDDREEFRARDEFVPEGYRGGPEE